MTLDISSRENNSRIDIQTVTTNCIVLSIYPSIRVCLSDVFDLNAQNWGRVQLEVSKRQRRGTGRMRHCRGAGIGNSLFGSEIHTSH